jgi:hypothetical protein
MALPQKLLARSVVLFPLLGMLPALQQPATVDAQDTATRTMNKLTVANSLAGRMVDTARPVDRAWIMHERLDRRR